MPTVLKKSKSYTGDSLVTYYGEFLASPVPLELSFNFCSHKCAFCFANLNRPDRTANVKATLNLLRDFRDRESPEARLLREGYPVVVSNRVDPFASSNHRVSLPIMEQMTAIGIPIAIQTRGGTGVDEALDFLRPSVWYVSMSMIDDGLRKRIEPGATTIESRFDLIAKLKSRGHRVVLGLNPVVREWLPDPIPLLERAKAAGVEGVWVQMLHFNRDQRDRLSPRERDAIGDDVIRRAMLLVNTEDFPYFTFVRRMAREVGLEVFSMGQAERSDFFKPYIDTYPKLFPTIQELVNQCHDEGWDESDLIGRDEFVEYYASVLPTGPFPVSHYVGSSAVQVLRGPNPPRLRSFPDLLSLTFSDHRTKACPVRSPAFAYVAEWDASKRGWIQLIDENGAPYLVFSPTGEHAQLYAERKV